MIEDGPATVPLWTVALTLPLVLVGAAVLSLAATLILRGRAKLSRSAGIVIAILATALAAAVAGALDPKLQLTSLLTILLALGFSVAGIAGYAALAAHFQAQPRKPVAELLAGGESDQVEYKSTARVNLHTGVRDERIEHVIAKTVCGFLNDNGGSLLIGVDDAANPLGLDADLATMKSPDVDRFELWLRDLLTTTLGVNAAAMVTTEFPEAVDADGATKVICVVRCRPSPRPVYLQAGKSATPEFWRRAGNSTRQLAVNEATEYVMHRWPLGLGASLAAQLLAAVRFSERG